MSYYILAYRKKKEQALALSDIFSKTIIGYHVPAAALPVEYDVDEDESVVSDTDTDFDAVEVVSLSKDGKVVSSHPIISEKPPEEDIDAVIPPDIEIPAGTEEDQADAELPDPDG